MYYYPETMSSVQQPSLQHRKNRCPSEQCIGPMTSTRCNGYKILYHRKNRRPSIGLTDGPRKLLQPCQRSQRLLQSAVWPEEPMPLHWKFRCLRRKVSNGSKRLVQVGGLYICIPPAIWSLLESQDITHASKNTSKPSKSIEIKSLVLSTSFVSISARLALQWVIKQGLDPCDVVLKWTKLVSRCAGLLGVLVAHR